MSRGMVLTTLDESNITTTTIVLLLAIVCFGVVDDVLVDVVHGDVGCRVV